ncbi:CCA tRNA nucleotidyltransferase [Gluconobacter kanchanaburiensis]|uniref:Poly(A) polymerase n=1 Tax=Gluconobacter kanchanaburiensis NBRC 103587 TaxID=1307948 RepID=A0A511B7W2_9PROT|nr:CCA tRNA nucleotidyltransferase [Gluconobacter kanchanaburiensis]MBF0861409.1 CCA tRNA nucleotidyltransferase [Gluconobacter kanchanaburiensis]GBR68239.1 polynucleotide adenylyltransferase [Gluconobacter kanchanaburiensis NBRC 103587]GEK95771.1 poly(A) polymerase [Gluconobacter kanchanaburiensis NBRC 103587]
MKRKSGLLERLADRRGLERIWNILPEARLVGGSVRDLLVGMPVHDLDLATPEPPEDVQRRLEQAGIRVFPTGLSHGTVTAVLDGTPYEITTLRRDEQTDGRHAVVVWTRDWAEDAARRDFTINAMSLDREDRLHDYFGGQQDLCDHRVRFVGNAALRVEEDALRALRFFRFHARYGEGVPDLEACTAISQRLELIAGLSAERIASEIQRILVGPRLAETITDMIRVGLLDVILPRPDPVFLGRLLGCDGPVDPLLRLFALCHESSDELGQRLKLSKGDQTKLRMWAAAAPVLRLDQAEDDLRRLRVLYSLDGLLARSWLEQAERLGAPDPQWNGFRSRLASLPQPEFPLSGKDAIAQGLRPGPQMGEWLRAGRDWWIANGCLPDREACLAYLGART